MTRRTLLVAASIISEAFLPRLRAAESPADPWSKDELMEPDILARILAAPDHRPVPVVISVAFPFLYRQRHVANARFAGPTSKPEGIAALRTTVSSLPKGVGIVIYCGCCPMAHCPNIRPAYQTLKDLGYRHIHVLNLPTNFHTDWIAKGYPVEPPASHRS